MAKIVIDNNPYPLPTNFTYRESDLMQTVAGINAADVDELWDAMVESAKERGDGTARVDPALALAFAAVAMRRDQPALSDQQIKTLLIDRQIGTYKFDFSDDAEAEAKNPEAAEAGGAQIATASADSTDETLEPDGTQP